jgi:hypothetical protein
MAKFVPFGTIEIQGETFEWHVRHFGGASTAYENHRGISVGVCKEFGQYRELIINFSFTDYFFDPPKSQSVFNGRLSNCIKEALSKGWKPFSRGKAFIHSALGED